MARWGARLSLVEEEPWMQRARILRLPPGKGLQTAWAENRTAGQRLWPNGEPQEPILQALGSMREGPDQDPAPEVADLDMGLASMDLTPEQLYSVRSIQERLLDLQVPDQLKVRQRRVREKT